MTENTHSTPDIWNVPVDERGTVLKMIPKADYDRLEEQLQALQTAAQRILEAPKGTSHSQFRFWLMDALGDAYPATGYRDEDSGVWIDKPGPHARRPSNPAISPKEDA